jgi:hypothetical protein
MFQTKNRKPLLDEIAEKKVQDKVKASKFKHLLKRKRLVSKQMKKFFIFVALLPTLFIK